MIEFLKLDLQFDAAALQRDLDAISADTWIPHFNQDGYEGQWSAVPLRGPADAVHPIQSIAPHPGVTEWSDTDFLENCPYIREALTHFQCPLLSTRLLNLAPGSVIREHTDHSLSIEDSELRLHVPIQTSPEVEFVLNGNSLHLGAGESWYLNVNLPHSVANRSARARIHLVVDCEVNEWLRNLICSSLDADKVRF